MSVTFENECVGCPPEIGCAGDTCPNRRVAHYFCDKCDAEVSIGELYDVDGEDLCEDCLKERFRKEYY